jgi:hypothetical protein
MPRSVRRLERTPVGWDRLDALMGQAYTNEVNGVYYLVRVMYFVVQPARSPIELIVAVE